MDLDLLYRNMQAINKCQRGCNLHLKTKKKKMTAQLLQSNQWPRSVCGMQINEYQVNESIHSESSITQHPSPLGMKY